MVSNIFIKSNAKYEIWWCNIRYVEHGVPQGSRLSSDLFLLYINDIVSCFKYAKLVPFANDNTIYITCEDLEDGIRKMNEDMERVDKWLNLNKMKLNLSKSSCMILNNKPQAPPTESTAQKLD